MDCSLSGSSVHGISEARILEWVAISFCRGSSRTRYQTHISCISAIGRWILYHWATREAWNHSVLSFYNWFTSLSIISLRFMYVVAFVRIPFLFEGWIVFHCVIDHIIFIHSSINGHLSGFYFLAIVNILPCTWVDKHPLKSQLSVVSRIYP